MIELFEFACDTAKVVLPAQTYTACLDKGAMRFLQRRNAVMQDQRLRQKAGRLLAAVQV
jgi:hypothetical protein